MGAIFDLNIDYSKLLIYIQATESSRYCREQNMINPNEIKACLEGYLIGAKGDYNIGIGGYVNPFFASRGNSNCSLESKVLKEITRRGFVLPQEFDPIIFAFHSHDINYDKLSRIDFDFSYYFDMGRPEKYPHLFQADVNE